MSDYPNSDMDPFWVEQRTRFLAERSTCAEPNACHAAVWAIGQYDAARQAVSV